MSANVKTADLAITIVVTLLKAAGLGPEADRILDAIEGAKSCIGLIDDIKNEIVSDPNKDLIRSLFKTMEEEVRSIKADLKEQGLGKDEIESTADALIETTRLTVKQLAQDDDALLDAAQLPDSFFKIMVHRAEPLPDWCDDTISTLYRRLLKRVSEEFVARAQNFDRFKQVALASLLRDFFLTKKQLNSIERGVQEDRATNLETNRVVKELAQHSLSSTPSRVFFGSRPDVVAGDRFVERDEHEQLKAVITDPNRHRTVLLSMRGCGKTQLAAALAKQCEDANWDLVAWINAVSRDTITSDLVELAKQLQIDTSDLDDQDKIVHRCLGHLGNAPAADRLIVFDNVEDIEDLRDRIPRGTGLRVVATTTSREADWEENGWRGISVGVFSRVESINYLLTVTGSQDRDTADGIAERLGDLPLAIAQAAATARNEQWTLASYACRLESSCGEKVIRRIRGHYYSYAVSVALRMATDNTLKRLEDSLSDAARRQLRALCLLAESGVPTHWLDPAAASALSGSHDAELDTAAERAHRALIALVNASIIHQSADGSTTMLHRLQAQVLRESWNETECDEARKSAAALLSKVDINMLPREDTKSRQSECIRLIEQLYAISSQEHCHSLFQLKEIILQLNQVFLHSHDLGLIQETLKLQSAVKIIQELFGRDDPITLNSRFNLASAYSSSGNLTDAVSLYESVLEDCTRILGADDSRTLTTRNNLAHTYQETGRLPEAISMFEQILDDNMRILGSNHPNTLATRNNLAGAHASAEHFTEAISLYESVLDDSMRILGSDHPNTLATRNNLAGAHCAAGHLTEAIDLYKQVIVDRTRVLGEDHPDTLTSCNALAGAHYAAGHLTEAINLYEQVLENRTQALGENHLDTLTTQDNLARVYASKGDFDKAIAMYQRLITIRTRLLDSDHPYTLVSRDNLAGVYALKGDFDKAIAMYEKSYKEHRRILGEKHPSTLASCINLAGAYESTRRFEDSIRLYEHGLNSCNMVFGAEHPKTQTARHNLAHAYVSAGFIDKAIPLYEQVLKVNTQTLDEYHPNLVTTRNNLAHAYRTTGQIDSAIALYEKVLTDRIHILGENHPDTLATRNNLAATYFEANRFSDAINIFERILTDCTGLLGKDDPRTLNARSNLGHTYALAGRLTNAFDLLIQVVNDYLSLLSNSHPDTLIARNNLAHAHALDGNLAEAIKQWQSVWIDCHKFLGPAHPLTGTVRENLEAARRELEQQEEDSANEESKQED